MSWSPEDEERLRRALQEEASSVVPQADALERIRERTHRTPWWQRPFAWSMATATAAAAVAVAVAVALNMDGSTPDRTALVDELDSAGRESDDAGDTQTESGGDDAVASAPPGEESTEVPDNVPEPDATVIMTVPAYFITETPAGPRLAREFRGIERRDSAAETALTIMFSGPVDPDYLTPWDPATSFRVTETDEAIEIELTVPDDVDPVPEDLRELAVQQVVYTVQAALQRTDDVRFLVDDATAEQVFGTDASTITVARAPQLDVRQLVQINNPTEGMSLTSPVEITGEAALFEAEYEWRIEQDGVVVDEGFGQSEAGQTFAPFSFEAELEPGEYEVIVTASDPSDGEGPGPMSDSRAFTLTDSP
jgi:hypothetical protein